AHAGAVKGHWHDGSFELRSTTLGPMLRRFGTVRGYYRPRERSKRKLRATTPVLVRHVGLRPDGVGATLEMRQRHGEHTWTWRFDPQVGEGVDFWNMGPIQGAITKVEQELGLPLTW